MSSNNTTTTATSSWTQLLNAVQHEESSSSASTVPVDDVSSIMRNPWDPFHCADWDQQQPSATCIARIKR